MYTSKYYLIDDCDGVVRLAVAMAAHVDAENLQAEGLTALGYGAMGDQQYKHDRFFESQRSC